MRKRVEKRSERRKVVSPKFYKLVPVSKSLLSPGTSTAAEPLIITKVTRGPYRPAPGYFALPTQ